MTNNTLCTDGKPTHHYKWSQVYKWNPRHQLASGRQWALLHQVQVSIMVIIISIFKPLIMLYLRFLQISLYVLGHYVFFPTSPWWLKLFPSKWFFLGMGLLLGTPLMSHRTVPDHTYQFPSLFPSISLSIGILVCVDPRRGCPSFYGKKGLKAQRG